MILVYVRCLTNSCELNGFLYTSLIDEPISQLEASASSALLHYIPCASPFCCGFADSLAYGFLGSFRYSSAALVSPEAELLPCEAHTVQHSTGTSVNSVENDRTCDEEGKHWLRCCAIISLLPSTDLG